MEHSSAPPPATRLRIQWLNVGVALFALAAIVAALMLPTGESPTPRPAPDPVTSAVAEPTAPVKAAKPAQRPWKRKKPRRRERRRPRQVARPSPVQAPRFRSPAPAPSQPVQTPAEREFGL